jgi:ABC-2 type transport system permease protein
LLASARTTWNSWWRSGPARRLVTIGALPVGILVWALVISAVGVVLRSGHLGQPHRLLPVLSLAVLVLTLFALATSVSFALASVYFSRDVEWLLLAPISSRLLLTYRLISQLVLGICLGVALGGPAVLALAVLYRSPAMVPLLAVDLIAALVMPMAVSLALVVTVVRVVPARWVKDAAALLVGLVGFGVAAIEIASAVRGGAGGIGASPFSHGVSLPGFLPPAWAASSLTDAARGEWGPAILLALALTATALAVSSASIVLAAPAVREGCFRAQLGSPRRRRRNWPSFRVSPVLAIVRKDWRTLGRDPAQLVQLLLPIGLFAVYLLAPRAGGAGLGMFRSFPGWYGPLTTAAFAALFAASGLGLRAFGAEGRFFWCLRISPLQARALLLSKLILPAVVAVGASLALMVTTEVRYGLPPGQIGFSSALLVLCVLGLVCLATGMGAVWPRLDWNDPRRAVGVWLAVAFMMVGAAYIAMCLVFLTLPLLLNTISPVISSLLAILVCGLCAAATASVSLRAGHRRLARMDV